MTDATSQIARRGKQKTSGQGNLMKLKMMAGFCSAMAGMAFVPAAAERRKSCRFLRHPRPPRQG